MGSLTPSPLVAVPLPRPLAALSAAAVALAVAAFSTIDANPTLYLYDALLATSLRKSLSLRDRRVWIAGASSGIGADLAEHLAGHGARLVLTARNEEGLMKVRGRCLERRAEFERRWRRDRGWGRRLWSVAAPHEGDEIENDGAGAGDGAITIVPLDVTKSEEVLSDAVERAVAAHGGIDVLFLNAGRGQLLPGTRTPAEFDREMMEINYHAPVRLANLVLSHDCWEERGRGHIVVTSSVAAKMAVPLCSSYAAAKHAVNGYFNTLRAECGRWLRVDLVCPGPIHTPFGRAVLTEKSQDGTDLEVGSRAATDGSGSSREEKIPKSKMSSARCASLMASSMIGPAALFGETWVSRQPTLGFTYLSQFLPTFSSWMLGRIGPLRIKAWEMGLPLYETSSWRKAAAAMKKEGRKKDGH